MVMVIMSVDQDTVLSSQKLLSHISGVILSSSYVYFIAPTKFITHTQAFGGVGGVAGIEMFIIL